MKQAYCEPFDNTRELVKYLNANQIQKEDVLDILDLGGQLFLIFYK